MERMNKEGERKLADAVKSVIEHSSAGSTPTQALTKVARDSKLSAEEVRRVGEAYNTTAQLSHHMKTSGDARCDSFPLADSELAVSDVFPSAPDAPDRVKYAGVLKQSQVGLNVWLWDRKVAPTMQKAASAQPAISRSELEMLLSDEHELSSKAAELDKHIEQLEREIPWTLEKAADAVLSNLGRIPFDRFEAALCAKFGKDASAVADVLWEAGNMTERGQKRAFDWSNYTIADMDRGGYGTVESLVGQSLALHDLMDKRAKVVQAKNEKSEKRAAVQAGELTILDIFEANLAKRGSFLSPAVDMLNGAKDTVTGGLDQTPPLFGQPIGAASEDQAKMVGSLLNPKTRDQLGSIKTQAVLHDLLSNDEVISKYDPAEVVKHYNLLQEHVPTVFEHQGVLTDALRRSLAQGGLSTQEYGQLSDVASKNDSYGGNMSQDLALGGAKKKDKPEEGKK